jgi:Ca2+-binding RTX toxin-like protein
LTGLGWYERLAWSWRGNQVAIAGGRSRPVETYPIHVGRADGTGVRAVTSPRLATEDDSSPAWSPDGTQIAFVRSVFAGPGADYRRAGVWVADVANHRERQLTHELAGTLAWSSTGDVIAADVGADIGDEIVLVKPDGNVERRISLSSLGRFDRGVSWSPDGLRLAVGGGAIVDRAGRLVGRYAPPSSDDAVSTLPSWSADASTIVFERARTTYDARTNIRSLADADLYSVPAEGGRAVRLTRAPEVDEDGAAFRPGPVTRAAGTPQPCRIVGGAGRDVIRGTSGDDLVDAGAGADHVAGRGGDDFLDGGPGNDTLRGGRGSDLLLGGAGADRIYAHDGASDSVHGGPGRDSAEVDRGLDIVGGVEIVRTVRRK